MKTSDEKNIEVVGCSSHPFLIATSSKDGSVNVWNCCAVPKLYFNFSIDVTDDQIANIFAAESDSGLSSAANKNISLIDKEKTWSALLPSFFMEDAADSDPTAFAPLGQSKTTANIDSVDNPKITFPPEEAATSKLSSGGFVRVSSLALSGFGGVNPSPFGCLVIVGCQVAYASRAGASAEETCLLVYKVDASDIRAVKNALFNLPPDTSNLLMMDDKYSNFASEIAASLPLNSTITDEMMMIADMNEDPMHIEIELAQSPEVIDLTNDSIDVDFVNTLKTANVFETDTIGGNSSNEFSTPNKLYWTPN